MSEAEKGTDDVARRSRPESAAERRARRKAAAAGGKATADNAGKTKTAPAGRKDASSRRTKVDVKEKRPSLPARFMLFLRQVADELRKVIWPTRKQMITYTIVVVVFVSFIVALVAGLDWVFGKAVFALFG